MSNVFAETQGDWVIYTSELGFRQTYARTETHNWILLSASEGMLNSSENEFSLSSTGGGYFKFTSNESFTLTITSDFSHVEVVGDSGNSRRGISNSSALAIEADNVVYVYFSGVVQPYVPYMFILGMVGLVSMFGGPICAIHLFKERDYRRAITIGCTITALGVGLFIAWLGAG